LVTNNNFIKSVKTIEECNDFIKNNTLEKSNVKKEVIDLYENYISEKHPDIEGGQFIKKEGIYYFI
jgi:hypothetical protein